MRRLRLCAALLGAAFFFASPAGAQVYPTSSAGTAQFGLAVSGVTTLTVPQFARCAEITVEGAAVRRTSDGSTPNASTGTLINAGTQWQDCGPLTQYKFYPVSGSPTLDVEYFK